MTRPYNKSSKDKDKDKEKEQVKEQVVLPPDLSGDQLGDFSAELIRQLNKEAGEQVAFNLGAEDAPTYVKRWVSTGSRLLDYIISNKRVGGFPEGRIVEVQGPASTGKSHLMFELAKSTQAMGGVVCYIDTENATSPENLKDLGLDVTKNFVFIQENCTENCFKFAEAIIMKSRTMTKDVPVTIIWDSIAACSPKAELEGEYEDNTIGLQARVLSKGMRKIANIIANKKVLFVVVNQQRMKIGVLYGSPITTPGGMAIPYAASVRLQITSGAPIKDKNDEVKGINVSIKTIKNKVARPFRGCELSILYGKGVNDDEQVFDVLRLHCETKGPVAMNGKVLLIAGAGAWKSFQVYQVKDEQTKVMIHDIKFYKHEFGEKVLNVPQFKEYINCLLDAAMILKPEDTSHASLKGIEDGDIHAGVDNEELS